VRLEGLGQLKNPLTSSGVEAATLRLVALCLNQPRYRVTLYESLNLLIFILIALEMTVEATRYAFKGQPITECR
jgi:hypothetical protein